MCVEEKYEAALLFNRKKIYF